MPNPDPDSVSWLRFLFASVTVIGLMAALGWGLKYVSMRGWLTQRGTARDRLKVIASLSLDTRRRLVIAQCDDKEYHLLLGVGGDLLLSTRACAPLDTTHGSSS
ncbi:MAG: flagellar biosynthetic protein FliO [Bdellovibrionales bacterium]